MTSARSARSLLTSVTLFAGASALASLMMAAEASHAEDAFSQLVKAFHSADSEPRPVTLQDSATSPDGKWVAERYLEFYPEDTAIQIALHHPLTSSVNGGPAFPYKPSLSYIPFKWVGDDALFKWLDNSTLLIAALEGNNQRTKPDGEFSEGTRPDEFNGVRLQYGFYTYDPDKPRIAASQRVFTKKADFTYRFEKRDGEGLPGVGCYLYMTAPDGAYLDNLNLLIRALKEFALKGKQPSANVPEKVIYAVDISTDKESRNSLGYATGAKVEDFSPGEGKALLSRGFKKAITPDGSPVSLWGIMYNLQDHNDLQAIIHKLLQGHLIVKVGFWLDNAEVIYSSIAAKDVTPIDEFERCIKENNITTSQERDKQRSTDTNIHTE